MIRIIKGDLLNTKTGCIAHQVNCQGVMGSGVAKQIRSKWPKLYDAYRDFCNQKKPEALLGDCQFTFIDDVCVVNMFAQLTYGRTGRHTDYDAFRSCCRIMEHRIPRKQKISMPYGIGCGLGGGDWETICRIIEEELQTHDVYLYRL